MATLEFGKRASLKESHNDFWEISCRYALEAECIREYLKDRASLDWSAGKNVALKNFENIERDIVQKYLGGDKETAKTISVSSMVKDRVIGGVIKKECPTKGAIAGLYLAVVFTVCIEFSVLLAQSFSDNPFILVFALVLASGGVCQGVGFGNLYYKRWLEETRRPDDGAKKVIPFIVAGSVFVLLVASIRGYFGGPIIFVTTVVLGLLVCLAETFLKFHCARRKQCFHDLEQAQREYATERHRVDLQKNEHRKYYENELSRIMKDGSTNGNVDEMVAGGVFNA